MDWLGLAWVCLAWLGLGPGGIWIILNKLLSYVFSRDEQGRQGANASPERGQAPEKRHVDLGLAPRRFGIDGTMLQSTHLLSGTVAPGAFLPYQAPIRNGSKGGLGRPITQSVNPQVQTTRPRARRTFRPLSLSRNAFIGLAHAYADWCRRVSPWSRDGSRHLPRWRRARL